MANIDWNAHAKAFGAQITGRVHLTKLVHDCLPTNHRINRYDMDNGSVENVTTKTKQGTISCVPTIKDIRIGERVSKPRCRSFMQRMGHRPYWSTCGMRHSINGLGTTTKSKWRPFYFPEICAILSCNKISSDGDKFSIDDFLRSGHESKKIIIL